MTIEIKGEFSPSKIREGLERIKDAFDKETERKTSNGSRSEKTSFRT